MNASKGYYCVIQFCPDPSRAEAANIGVLLFCPERRFISARTAGRNTRVRQFFGPDSFDRQQLDAAKRAIEERLQVERDQFRSLDDLERFIDTRANEIIITPPRLIRVVDPERELADLFDELVGGPARREPRQPEIPELDQALRAPRLRARILFDQRVEVPVLGRAINVPYAYRNGRLNLVKPQNFSAEERPATLAAIRLAVEGDLLQRYPEPSGTERRLIVVSAFAGNGDMTPLRNRVAAILGEYSVRTVPCDAVRAFVDEVEQQAH